MNTPVRRIRTGAAPILLLAFGLFLAGCGTVAHKATFMPGFDPRKVALVRVDAIVDAAPKDNRGDQANFDIANYLRIKLEEKLDETALLAPRGSAEQHYVLKAEIVEYEPGNAFGRGLFPGVGSTVLSVECKLYDGDKMIGTISAVRTVKMGGVFTIGAWHTIFNAVADDIVGELKEKLASGA